MPAAQLRLHFPFFSHPDRQDICYLDSAATTQKPATVLEAMQRFYLRDNVNVHRGNYQLAAETTAAFEQVRQEVADFIGAAQAREIVFTKGTTDGINLLASCLGRMLTLAGKHIVVSAMEHHANIVPWQQLAEQTGAKLVVIPVSSHGCLDLSTLDDLISPQTAIVSVGHVSNSFGNIQPIEPIIQRAKQCGAVTIIDGAQAVAHLPVDVRELGCDFYVFSGHKMYGPTGIGVLYGRYSLLNELPPYQTGGEMIKRVSFTGSTFLPAPLRFEPGTPNIQGVIGLGAAIRWLTGLPLPQRYDAEQRLYRFLCEQLSALEGVTLWGNTTHSVPTVSFSVADVDHQDVAVLLDGKGIALRNGHHCTMPLMEAMNLSGTLRVSLGLYNTIDDVKRFIAAMSEALITLRQEDNEPALLGQLTQQVVKAKGWENKYRYIMLAGKHLTAMSDELYTEANRVNGCESRVWLAGRFDGQCWHWQADSDSKIVKGLLSLLLEQLNQQTSEHISNFDLKGYFAQLGITHHLSPSRSNGLQAVIKQIQSHLAQ